MKKLRLFIDGMHCINCSNSVKNEAKKLGVIESRVDFLNKFGEFIIDDEFDSEKLIYAIKRLGFSVSCEKIETKKSYEGYKLIILAILSALCFVDFSFFSTWFFATFAIILSFDFYKRVLLYKSYGMDLLVTLGISINYLYSFFSPHHFFFEASFVCFVIRLGKFIENRAKQRANALIKPQNIPFVSLDNGLQIKANEIRQNDLILVKNGEEILVDGISENKVILNESVISGESKMITKNSGELIYAGSINVGESFYLKASSNYYDSSLERLKDEAMKAGNKELKAFKLLDIISKYFVLFIIIIAFITGLVWYFIDSSKVFFYVSSVLLISCPCALGFAIPMVIAISINLCFKEQIILKNPELIHAIKDIDCFVFDKTGTLTNDIEECSHNLSDGDFRLIASIQNRENHPIARSITKDYKDFLKLNGSTRLENNILYYEEKHLQVKIIPSENEFQCYKNDIYIGTIKLSSSLNKGALELIEFLKNLNKRIIIISGDSLSRVKSIATKLNISEFYYRVKPEDKAKIIKDLKAKTVFIGDGANDIKALRAASFGISFSSANALAKNKADAILLDNNLFKIQKLFKIFDKSYSKIKQNLFISFFYNLIGISLACGLFSEINLHLNPALCAMLMSISSLIVIFNSLLLFNDFKNKSKTY